MANTSNKVVWYKNTNGVKEGVCNTLNDLLTADISDIKIGSTVIVGGGSFSDPSSEFPLDAKVFMLFPSTTLTEEQIAEGQEAKPQWKEL